MTIFQSLILSFIEGITEFLPISSTGHMILASRLMGIQSSEFTKSFEIFIQLGAILAIVCLYGRNILKTKKLILPILSAFIPTGIIGLMLYKLVKHYLLDSTAVVSIALIAGGILMLVAEQYFKRKNSTEKPDNENISLLQAVFIGIIQTVSMIPGVSRSMATIYGGQLVGLTRDNAVEFSFLLAIPTMLTATALDLVSSGFSFDAQEWLVLGIGFAGAFISALIVVPIFTKYIRTHSFTIFGIYRILLGMCYLFVVR